MPPINGKSRNNRNARIIPGIDLRLGDCLKILPTLEDDSVDLIIADPPYFKVKSEWWDRQWDSERNFLDWIGRLCEQWRRVLKANGSLYVFASPKMADLVSVEVRQWFNLLNRITWKKPPFSTKAEMSDKSTMRTFFPVSEAILFAEHYGADNIAKGEAGYAAKCDQLRGFLFEPLRAYLDGERKRAGIDKAAVNEACGFSPTPGGMASRHYFSRSQWLLPTAEHYAAMQRLFNASCNGSGPQYLCRDYEYLRRDYEDLRRPFSVSADVPYTDVWDFATVNHYSSKHPCEKPTALLRHIVTASSREAATVLDPFAGSCVLADVCRDLNRRYIGIEIDEEYYEVARKRIVTGYYVRNPINLMPSAPTKFSFDDK